MADQEILSWDEFGVATRALARLVDADGYRPDVPVVLPPTLDLVDVAGLRVLVADDVADTGHTLRLVREVLVQHVAEARTAVLYRKPRSVVVPDYAWREIDRWAVFPWSAEPPVTDVP